MRTLIAQTFSLLDVTDLRHAVSDEAQRCGLRGPRLDDFVLAVHESVVNVIEHAGGCGRFKLWTVDGVIRSETSDRGSGIPEAYLDGGERPSEQSFTGRGIYLIRRLCDAADFRTSPDGTTVVLTMRLPRGADLHTRRSMRRIRVRAPGRRPFGRFTA